MIPPIVSAARRYLNTKFQHQGRSERGVDCAGLIVLAAKDCGYLIADQASYSHILTNDELKNAVLDHCVKSIIPSPGCFALFQLPNGQQHIAIVSTVHPTYIIHAYAPMRKVVEHRLQEPSENEMYIHKGTLIGYYQWQIL